MIFFKILALWMILNFAIVVAWSNLADSYKSGKRSSNVHS